MTLTGLGVFVLGVALLARFYAYDRLAVVPLDQDTVSVSEGPGATIFDIASQQEITVDLVSTRNVVGDVEASEEASDELGRDIAVWETLVYTDEPGAVVDADNPPRSGTHDRVAFDRHTGEAVACCDTFTSTSSDDRGEEIRDTIAFKGLYFKFPFQTEQKTYQFWDGSLGEAVDIDFKGTETIEGLETYRFEQTIPPSDIGDITAPASFFGIDEDGDVTLDRVYGNTRTLWIEPETGVIIRGQEDQLTVAEYEGEQVATLTDVTIGYNPETIKDNAETYSALATQLKAIRIWVPIGGAILGLILLAAGLVLLLRNRRQEPSLKPKL
ncbi:hypothetical protein F4692_003889 [Nocardioides cavernae]|uniref:DUF3068 domain-containing protein n=1 Tax=Nocardioides cavernae TaxID=1921566 RepID=A0A7Y9H6E4_9ACTN|nr:DUF3068 domain-containing protein [Nocardioides cavernae]NYE38738.1 hypothetical protein [Nocardioides cavernae]